MSGLRWLIRDYIETCAGKIAWRHFVTLFLPAPSRKKRLTNWKGEEWPTRIDADGREYSCFKGGGVHCSNVDLWAGKYPRIEDSRHPYSLVGSSDCKACQYHEPPKRGRRFACCAWDRERRKSSPTPAQIAHKALRDAQEMIGS